MFGFLDFWGDLFTLSWSGGATYVLLWFNRYVEAQVESFSQTVSVSNLEVSGSSPTAPLSCG